MELSLKTGEKLGRILLAAALIGVGLVISAYLHSDFSKGIAKGKTVRLVVLTAPPAIIVYDSSTRKAFIHTTPGGAAQEPTKAAQAAAAINAAGLTTDTPQILYYAPSRATSGQSAVDSMQEWFNNWRANPLILARFAAGYIKARIKGNSNIGVTDFIAVVMEASRLEWPDFMIISASGAPSPATKQTIGKPLSVEVFNASGRPGLAVMVTRQLRAISDSGPQKIDVLRYDNYRNVEPKSRIIDHTGRIDDISQLAHDMGLVSGEIVSERGQFTQVDATVIIGEDYRVTDWEHREMLH